MTESTASSSDQGRRLAGGIAVADNDTIRGFDETYFYFVGHLAKYGRPKRRVLAMRYAPQAQGFSNPGFPATVYSEEGEEEFLLKRRGGWRLKH